MAAGRKLRIPCAWALACGLSGPVLERLHDELFIPLMDRTFECMRDLDMLPPCPPELAGRRLRVEFVSLLAQAQKLVGINAADQYLALTLKASAAWPEALDTLNVDHLLDNYAESLGLPVNLTRSSEERQQLRAARAEAAQAQVLTEAVQKGVGMVRELAQSPLESPDGKQGTVLGSLVRILRHALPGGFDRTQAEAEPELQAKPAAKHEPKPVGNP